MFYQQRLTNGMRIVVEEMPSVRSVSLGVWIGTGSRDEDSSNNGISHLIEHMMFKGTHTRTARQIAELFDGIGGQVNAFTSKEYTCYYAKVLDEHFHLAIDTLADMLNHSLFDEDELAKERKVIIEEIKMYEDAPDEIVHDLIAGTVYQSHPLGFTILGPEQNLKQFNREDLVRYVKNHYTPDNMVLAVAGNVKMQEVVDVAEKLFARPQGTLNRSVSSVPIFNRDKRIKSKSTEQAHICLAVETFPFDDSRVYPLILLNNLLGGSSSSRLFQEIREDRGMAYSVYSYYSSYRDSGMFGVYAGTSPDQAQTVLDLICEILRDTAVQGVTEDELRKAKEQVKGSLMLSLESTSSRMSRLGKNELLLCRRISLDETLEQIQAVSLQDMSDLAAFLCGQKYSLAAVGPFEDLTIPQ